MSMQFVYGRSGTGKSTYIYNEIKEKINTGSKIYIITPEQFSFTAEKKLIDITNGASINAEVLSFERMAHRVSSEVSGSIDTNLSESGKAIMLYNILEKNKKELKFLGSSDENIDLVSRQLTELKKHNISNEMLSSFIMEIDNNQYLKTKLEDVSLIYNEFNRTIENRYIDENDILTLLAERIPKSESLKDSIIYIDEFAGFTTQEYLVIQELLKQAQKITVTICTDELESRPEVLQSSDVFGMSKDTIERLVTVANKTGSTIEPAVKLPEEYRFKSPELKHLEKNLYGTQYEKYMDKQENISLFLSRNPYSEITNVAKEILLLVREEGYRYRDISVITKNIDTYGSNIKAIFSGYEIPVFIDEKKDLSSNLYIKYITSILDIFAKNWSYEAMFNYIKSGFLDIDRNDIYNLEKYAIKYGIKGNKWYKEDFKIAMAEDLEYINNLRTTVVNPLIKFKNNLQGTKTAKEISLEIYRFLVENNINKVLNEKVSKLEGIGELDTASELTSAMDIVISLLDEIVTVLGEERITFDKYSKVFKVGLKNHSLGKIPMTIDQVIVGDVDRSRTHKVKAIFIIGLNDGVFPSVNKQEGFINDADREYLKQHDIELAKGTAEKIYEEQFNIYKAFTGAEEKLFLSYTSSDMEGLAMRPSVLVSRIKKIFIDLKEKSDIIEETPFIGNMKTTFEELLCNLRIYEDGKDIDDIWFDLLSIYKEDPIWRVKLEKALEGLKYTNTPQRLTEENISKLYGQTLKTSISKLEQYRNCPYSFHIKYGLRLKEEETFKVQALDTGSFMHEVIDSFFEEVKEKGLDIKAISNEEIKDIIDRIIVEKLNINKNYIFTSSPKFLNLTKRLKKVIFQSIESILYQLRVSDFEIMGTEIEFKEGAKYSPIILDLEDGRKVEITGKIDRVDIARFEGNKYIRIIDYKSSSKDINLNEFIAGVQIQLITYLDAMTKIEDVLPAGMFYFNLIDPQVAAKQKLNEEEIKERIKEQFKMNGLLLANINIVKMMDNTIRNKQQFKCCTSIYRFKR